MTKKEYLKPAMRVEKIMQAQMLCGSINNLTTTGLDDLSYDNNGGNQGNAWSRTHNDSCDDEEEEW